MESEGRIPWKILPMNKLSGQSVNSSSFYHSWKVEIFLLSYKKIWVLIYKER